jgi:hypothetical protein
MAATLSPMATIDEWNYLELHINNATYSGTTTKLY